MNRPRKGKPDRDIMLAQAEVLFSERGFGACSLRDVIGAMKCSTTAFYSRFDDKESVFEELVQELVGDLHQRAAAALAEVRSAEAGLDAGIGVLVGTLVPRKRIVSVLLSEGNAIDGIRTVLQNSLTLLAALIDQQLSAVQPPPPPGIAWALVGAIHLQIVRWAVFEDVSDSEFPEALRAVAVPLVPGL